MLMDSLSCFPILFETRNLSCLSGKAHSFRQLSKVNEYKPTIL